jgi:proteic killer suppression protein
MSTEPEGMCWFSSAVRTAKFFLFLIMLGVINVYRYYRNMIVDFRDADTKLFWNTGKSRRIPAAIRRMAVRKLMILNAAVELDNLRVPPGNRLEEMATDRKGQHSIRVNDQFRICFIWRDGNAHNVEIVDYH